MEIGCVDCLHGCVWDWKKPSISDDGGGAGGQHIRHNVVLHSHTTERRPRQHADMEGCCDADWGLRFRKLQRTWSVPYEHNCCFGFGYVSSFCQFIEFVQRNIEQLHGDYVGIPSTLKLLCVLGRVEWK